MEEDNNNDIIKSFQEELKKLRHNHLVLMINYKMLLIEWQANLSMELDELITSLKNYVSEKKEQGEIISDIEFSM